MTIPLSREALELLAAAAAGRIVLHHGGYLIDRVEADRATSHTIGDLIVDGLLYTPDVAEVAYRPVVPTVRGRNLLDGAR